MRMTTKLQEFFSIFGVPVFIRPWIDRFFQDSEIELVMRLANTPLDCNEINRVFHSELKHDSTDASYDLAGRAYQKGIINRRDDGRFEPADFHARFDKWAMFESWKNIPDEIRSRLNAWEFAYYEKQHAGQISALKMDQPRKRSLIYPEYILLDETEALLDLVTHIYLMPCNCRSMMRNCSQSVYTCLRFESDRGIGWEISKFRAKEIVRTANKNGLMQSAEVGIAADGTISGAICNCCSDCCYPHMLAEHCSAQKLWPLSRYVARYLSDRCTACGRCVKRCPFQAFISVKKNQAAKPRTRSIFFNKNLCRGCGVCSTGCPENAIEMIGIDYKASLLNEILK